MLRQGAVLVVVHYAGVAIIVVAVFGLFAMLASAAIVIICDISHYTAVVLARRCLWAWFCCHRYSPCSLLLAILASSYPCLDGLPTLASRSLMDFLHWRRGHCCHSLHWHLLPLSSFVMPVLCCHVVVGFPMPASRLRAVV